MGSKDEKPEGSGFFSAISSSVRFWGSAVQKSVNGLLGYEGLEVINPEGGTEDAEAEAERGRWKKEHDREGSAILTTVEYCSKAQRVSAEGRRQGGSGEAATVLANPMFPATGNYQEYLTSHSESISTLQGL